MKGQFDTLSASTLARCQKVRRATLLTHVRFLEASHHPPYIDIDPSNPEESAGFDPVLDLLLFVCSGSRFSGLQRLKLVMEGNTAASHYLPQMLIHIPNSVRSLELDLFCTRQTCEELIMLCFSLRTLRVRLHELVIKGMHPSPTQEEVYATMFTLNTTLGEEMRLLSLSGCLDGERLLPIVADLPLLEELNLPLGVELPTSTYNLTKSSFPKLTAISLSVPNALGEDHRVLVRVLKSVSSPALRKISFASCSVEGCAAVLTILGNRWAGSIDDIEATIESHTDVIPPIAELFKPLLRSTQLRSLSFSHASVFNLNIDQMHVLISSFPRLETLCLGDDVSADQPLRNSPKILRLIARGLSRLRRLTIAINFTLDDSEYSIDQSLVPLMTLVEFDLFRAVCSNPGGAVAFVRRLFPNVVAFPAMGLTGMKEVAPPSWTGQSGMALSDGEDLVGSHTPSTGSLSPSSLSPEL